MDLIKIHDRFRSYMNTYWATPDIESALEYAFTEFAEYIDALIRERRSNDTRNSVKFIDAKKELAQCAFMLLTALSHTINTPASSKKVDGIFASQRTWLKSHTTVGDFFVLLGIAMNTPTSDNLARAFCWVYDRLSIYGRPEDLILDVMEIWQAKFNKENPVMNRNEFKNIVTTIYDSLPEIVLAPDFQYGIVNENPVNRGGF